MAYFLKFNISIFFESIKRGLSVNHVDNGSTPWRLDGITFIVCELIKECSLQNKCASSLTVPQKSSRANSFLSKQLETLVMGGGREMMFMNPRPHEQ